VQRYTVGDYVAPHQDPATLIGVTVICVFGDFQGATSSIEHTDVQLTHGDVLFLRTKMADRQCAMPLHSVSPVLQGVRYVMILAEDAHKTR
jgi:hypothetical protein